MTIDIGGTFTDLVAYDEASEELLLAKAPSTPPLFIDGVMAALSTAGIEPQEIVHFRHGSTIATNAIIERRPVKTGLLTTRGMRDVLGAGRANRPDLFNSNWDPSPPLVPRRHVLEATERVDYEGTVLTELSEEDVRLAARTFAARGIEAVAVSYLNSFMNPENEIRSREILQEELPEGVHVYTSAETLPEIREFERTSTVVASAYLAPIVNSYLDALVSRLKEWGYQGEVGVTHSGGGMLSTRAARSVPARICQSGPAGGVVGGLVSGSASGYDNVITFDMGGTSADLSLVVDGKPSLISEWRVDWNIPILFPAIDLVTIGAGGGTIAWVDDGGSLRCGPQSAGADPGPACFGKGSMLATTTDAHLVLGRLSPERPLGASIKLQPDLASKALQVLGEKLDMSVMEVAHGILRIANTNMTMATHLISVQRGHDPRDFTLVAGGGAGPLHGVDIARELGIPRVVIPRSPGLTSALGILHVVVRNDFQRPVLKQRTQLADGELAQVFSQLVGTATSWFDAEQIPEEQRRTDLSVDARYYGQTSYMNLELEGLPKSDGDVDRLVDRFEDRCRKEFGYVLPRDFADVEFVNARVAAIGAAGRAKLPTDTTSGTLKDARIGERQVYFEEAGGTTSATIYERERLRSGMEFAGPAIVEQLDSTIVLPPGAHARVDDYLHLVIDVLGA
ncbi:MAG TPA: hydantoinase/oxoprolinase family protein [Acidimicrobiales bacterium]|nr:hydantoinase/oxoprolinase family protein [Acidimicrobiales bacterium]